MLLVHVVLALLAGLASSQRASVPCHNRTSCALCYNLTAGTEFCSWCSSSPTSGLCVDVIELCPGGSSPSRRNCSHIGDAPVQLDADNERVNDSFTFFLVVCGTLGATLLLAVLLALRRQSIIRAQPGSRKKQFKSN